MNKLEEEGSIAINVRSKTINGIEYVRRDDLVSALELQSAYLDDKNVDLILTHLIKFLNGLPDIPKAR